MTSGNVLIIDDDSQSIDLTVTTLNDAQVPYTLVDSNEAARNEFATADFSLIIVRAFGANIRGADLCRDIRRERTAEQLPILAVLGPNQVSAGAEVLLAGANDLLIDPFEPRELRMRANIVPPDQRRRVDAAHTHAVDSAGLVAEPVFHVPEFDPQTKRINFGANEHQRTSWELDPATTKVSLDKVIVCPECESVPTFRPGCGACGSAWVEEQVLLHHYACAHVGPESDFRGPGGLVCPKCRLDGLVAGSDFERTDGCQRCLDCNAVFTKPRMICHCLSCQHRFPADQGRLMEIHGYQVGASPASAAIPAPNFVAAAPAEQPAETPNR